MPTFQSYAICATPRSGSTLLCDLLGESGVAGRPASYFRRQSIAHWAQRLGVPSHETADGREFNEAYVAAVKREGRAGTGLFGVRLMWETVEELSQRLDTLYPGLPNDAARFSAAFGPMIYVHLSRQDKVAQAVSLQKAIQTGLWHVAADGSDRERTMPPAAPVFDAGRIAGQIAELTAHDDAWTGWFERHQIEPVLVNYETLSADPPAVLAQLLAAFGHDPSLAAKIAPRTRKMADVQSLEWAARYRAEMNPSG